MRSVPIPRSMPTGWKAARWCLSCVAPHPRHGGGSSISEYDYSMSPAAPALGVEPRDARLFMVFDGRWKYVHAVRLPADAVRPGDDPDEFRDLGRDPAYAGERERLAAALAEWGLRLSQRTALSDGQIKAKRGTSQRRGILIGVWDEADIPDELWSAYLGRNS